MGNYEGDILKFIQSKHYMFLRNIGRGGTGETILLKDEITDYNFVCKKYSPIQEKYRNEFFERFIDEIKIMYPLYHPNIVRIFNYFLYPNKKLGYILMEHIQGSSINTYLDSQEKETFENIFVQLIDAFSYLESKKILHRDIRDDNILITNEGVVKIIDFGFGKQLERESEQASIKLNWPVSELPNEIGDLIYNHKTEIYFVGKLYKRLLENNNIENFKYTSVLDNMIKLSPDNRSLSFYDIQKSISGNKLYKSTFTENEKEIYRDFADELIGLINYIKNELFVVSDTAKVEKNLKNMLEISSLEEKIQNNSTLIRCFITSGYNYTTSSKMDLDLLKSFYNFYVSQSNDNKEIILKNLENRFSSIKIEYDFDDIPF